MIDAQQIIFADVSFKSALVCLFTALWRMEEVQHAPQFVFVYNLRQANRDEQMNLLKAWASEE